TGAGALILVERAGDGELARLAPIPRLLVAGMDRLLGRLRTFDRRYRREAARRGRDRAILGFALDFIRSRFGLGFGRGLRLSFRLDLGLRLGCRLGRGRGRLLLGLAAFLDAAAFFLGLALARFFLAAA